MKLVVLDLDGTLLDSDCLISKYNQLVINTLQQQGVKFIIATGRPYHGCINYYQELKLDTYLITDNGGSIYLPSVEGFKTIKECLDLNDAKKLFKDTKHMLESAFFSSGDVIYNYRYNQRLHDIFIGNGNLVHQEVEFDELSIAPTGMIYLVYASMMQVFEEYVQTTFEGKINLRLWGSDQKHAIYEVYNAVTSKLSAIKQVCDAYQISLTDVISFGDGINDVEMVKGVGLGIAMSNAEEVVKRVASKISVDTNDHSGVGKTLVKLFDLTVKESE